MHSVVSLRTTIAVCLFAVSMECPSPLFAQSGLAPAAPATLGFKNFLVAKSVMRQGKPAIAFEVCRFVTEARTKTVSVTRMIAETRTRTVNRNGNDVEEAYTVMVPVEEEISQEYTAHKPVFDYVTIPLDDLSVHNQQGRLIAGAELTQRLRQPTRVLVVPAEDGRLDPFFSDVLKDDVLLVNSPKLRRAVAANHRVVRSWTKSDGEVIVASLLRVDGARIHLLGDQGKVYRVLFEQLSQPDQLYIRVNVQGGSRNTAQPSAPPAPPAPQPQRSTLADYVARNRGPLDGIPMGNFPAIPPRVLRQIPLKSLEGTFHHDAALVGGEENDYLRGTLKISSARNGRTKFIWTNAANVRWELTADLNAGRLVSDPDAPYHQDGATSFWLVPTQDANGDYEAQVAGFCFQGTFYGRE